MPVRVFLSRWNYVIAAYSITAAGLVAYAWSLALRRRKSRTQEEG